MTTIRDAFDLSGKLAVVTGARRGIGRAIAEALADAGADVIGVSASQEPSKSAVQSSIEALGRVFVPYRVDFADCAAVAQFAANLAAEGRTVDILVNNAGTIRRSPAVSYSNADWNHVINIDLSAQFVLSREIGRQMVERGRGKIIFITSLLSFQGGICVSSYAAAKSGLAGLTRALANEWAPYGVNVNAIAPGYVITDNTKPLVEDNARYQSILERIPAGRWGVPHDLAGAAVFLASAASDYVSGTILTVDGGWMGR